MTDSEHTMPAAIAARLIAIKKAIAPAIQSHQDRDGERTFSYATVDDVFAATQKHMAEAGILIEMLDGGLDFLDLPGPDGMPRASIHMQFHAVITAEDGMTYANPRNTVHMVGIYEGMKTCSALRSLAEKTFMKSLFKLPTTAAEQQAEAATLNGGGYEPGSAAVAPSPSMSRPRNPLMLGKLQSAEERDRIIAALDEAAASADGDNAARIAAIQDAFKANQSMWSKLTPVDQEQVKKHHAGLVTRTATGRPAAVA